VHYLGRYPTDGLDFGAIETVSSRPFIRAWKITCISLAWGCIWMFWFWIPEKSLFHSISPAFPAGLSLQVCIYRYIHRYINQPANTAACSLVV
jgi:hypothetical protein